MNVTIGLTEGETLAVIDLLNQHLPKTSDNRSVIAVFDRALEHARAEAAVREAKLEEERLRHAVGALAFPADVRRRLAELTERFDAAKVSSQSDRTQLAMVAVEINAFVKRVAQEIDAFTRFGDLTNGEATELAAEVSALRRRAFVEGMGIPEDRLDGLLR